MCPEVSEFVSDIQLGEFQMTLQAAFYDDLPCDSVDSMCYWAHVFLVQMLLSPYGWISCHRYLVFFCKKKFVILSKDKLKKRIMNEISE